jgi:hypothetical protein
MKCFVIMPFDKSFNGVYGSIKKSIQSIKIGEEVSYSRLDEVKGAGRITEDLIREISEASVCVADITGRDPNVWS